ncbi:hypothetical protein NDU88_006082 [Pleurodeles waltl]|uniref:Uncharacterized protein n=1 Tax=Pleurodeles waltl TaxID=8319 RepID=A0AAV7WZ00_PLEWA|nr:hypothetical protein NDU88_006082 [Pleurodeles waltl]
MVSGGKEGVPGIPGVFIYVYALSAARIETRFGVSYPAAPALKLAAGETGHGMCRNPEAELRLPPLSARGLPRSQYIVPQRPTVTQKELKCALHIPMSLPGLEWREELTLAPE